MTKRLDILVSSSPASNDHQARILVDGVDWLGPDALGLDPPELKNQLRREQPQQAVVAVEPVSAIVGRCSCGCVGCSDTVVRIYRYGTTVEWIGGPVSVAFDAAQYDAEHTRFEVDRSWETLDRTVEREVGDMFAGTILDGKYAFDWASARIEAGLILLSYSSEGDQKLLRFKWDQASSVDAVQRAAEFRRRTFPDS
ncbi:hypothetical protein [Sphingomonas sp. G-3-2-10]|uniref:hypothetical protein n=1 Tax=Sphingomonas sp. G-3-2-10 TaxID=2728838 RepID=UPI00146E6F17|nr:hypothetical protein [Sphingomonas sp. G-3-2-10]NML07133.1 hypothetical protein [Sphingomonas sp. G-3-2-10]